MANLRATVLATAVVVAAISTDPARAATVTLTPASPRPGETAHIAGAGFRSGAGAIVQLGRATQTVAADAAGRVFAVIPVAASAPTGARRLVVRTGPLRVATTVSISRRPAAAATLAARSSGERLVLEPAVAAPGVRIRLRGSGFRGRPRVAVRLGSRSLGSARPSRGAFTFRGPVPRSAAGVRGLAVRWDGARVELPFAVDAGSPKPVVVGAAGDIACEPPVRPVDAGPGSPARCAQDATARVLAAAAPAAVLPLGDTQYGSGTLAAYAASYASSWGRFDLIAHPAPGDEEYESTGAGGYYAYFGRRAGPPGLGYYSFDVGAWHLVALNSECDVVGCDAASAQAQWLRADLAAHPSRCTLAYWHRPRFTSGTAAQAIATDAFWRDLYAAGADVILAGHNHNYERFAPQTPGFNPDAVTGIREFVAGTGGESVDPFSSNLRPNSEVRIAGVAGVLLLTLRADGYDWRFVAASGAVLDAGSAPCH